MFVKFSPSETTTLKTIQYLSGFYGCEKAFDATF